MTTEEKTQYEKDEDRLIDLVEEMVGKYGVNLGDIIDILKDRVDDEQYCDNPSCLKKGCSEKH